MDVTERVGVIDVGLTMMSISVFSAGDVRRWCLAVPTDAAVMLTDAELLVPGGRHSVALDRLLHMAVTTGGITTMAQVVLLSRSWVHPLFYTYVLRWLHAAVPSTTSVSQLPQPLFAVQCAGLKSGLVVQCDNGVMFATPVLDGVISCELESVWGDVGIPTRVSASLVEDRFREVGVHLTEMMQRKDQRTPSEGYPQSTCSTSPQPTSLSCAEDLLLAAEKHIAACRKRELRSCLETVVLCGDAAIFPAARKLIAQLLSASLPHSLLVCT
ncbi:hypothetical protein LtaPh_2600900 [Leishmania tarentolae]|uniref:Actin-like protein n=1 Tax=Leishmania tarentolae TaxID=5689 RepID=A0A640KJX0_LEITA|nr:hypothetical protein LtaPh_2600900 [Leishmania tarentolae]